MAYLRASARYPLEALTVAQVCDGEYHVTLETDRLRKPVDRPLTPIPCNGFDCKGWYKVKRQSK